jgi:general secretion pathway protein C
MSKWHILGVYEPRDVDALSPTALNLTLVGVMSSPSQASAKAIIANANGKQELYGVNDEPLAGVKIYKVLTDSVILEHDGQFEVLTLPKQPLIFSGPNRSLFG